MSDVQGNRIFILLYKCAKNVSLLRLAARILHDFKMYKRNNYEQIHMHIDMLLLLRWIEKMLSGHF
jgi:hypothetical protein